MMELKREIEMQRKAVMEKINNDLKAQIKRLNEEGITEEEKKQIETLIDIDK